MRAFSAHTLTEKFLSTAPTGVAKPVCSSILLMFLVFSRLAVAETHCCWLHHSSSLHKYPYALFLTRLTWQDRMSLRSFYSAFARSLYSSSALTWAKRLINQSTSVDSASTAAAILPSVDHAPAIAKWTRSRLMVCELPAKAL